MSAHIPGPWKVVVMDDVFIESQSGFVAIVPRNGCYKSGEELLANARLIAAAPELLDALKVSLSVLNMAAMTDSEDPGDVSEDQSPLEQVRKKVRAAIAKATGGAQ